jgi:hypothetical protein
MKKLTWTRAILIFLMIATLGGLVYVLVGILGERTIIPATEYDDSPEVEAQAASSTENGSEANDTTRQITGTNIPQAVIVKGKTAKGKDTTYTIYTAVPSTTTTNNGIAEQASVVAGRKLGPSDFHINHKLNARLRFSNFLNTFKEGDYVTGSDLALIYGNDKEINTVVRKIVVKYFQDHIDYIQRRNGELIINTVNQQPAITRIHVPLLIDMNLTINHGSKISLGKTFVSKEKNFNNIMMLPLDLKDIEIKQSDDAMPSKGYVSGDNFYVNYPAGLECYKLK